MTAIKKAGYDTKNETFTSTVSTVFTYITYFFILINYVVIAVLSRFDFKINNFLLINIFTFLLIALILSKRCIKNKKGVFNFVLDILIAVCSGFLYNAFKTYISLSVFFTNIVVIGLNQSILRSVFFSLFYYFIVLVSYTSLGQTNINRFLYSLEVLIIFISMIYLCNYFSEIERSKIKQDEEFLKLLDEKTSLVTTLDNKKKELEQTYWDMVETLIGVIEARDNFTGGHSVKVCEYSVKLAQKIGLGEDEISDIMKASILHDIGKMGIPDNILLKPSALSKDEYGRMMTHPEIGCRILSKVKGLECILPMILYHHERVDGAGYPYGLDGDKIPLGAKIIAIADAYDAMTSNRPYRKALLKKEAKKRLLEGSGKQFDADLVQKFIEMIDDDNINNLEDYRYIEVIKKHTKIV